MTVLSELLDGSLNINVLNRGSIENLTYESNYRPQNIFAGVSNCSCAICQRARIRTWITQNYPDSSIDTIEYTDNLYRPASWTPETVLLHKLAYGIRLLSSLRWSEASVLIAHMRRRSDSYYLYPLDVDPACNCLACFRLIISRHVHLEMEAPTEHVLTPEQNAWCNECGGHSTIRTFVRHCDLCYNALYEDGGTLHCTTCSGHFVEDETILVENQIVCLECLGNTALIFKCFDCEKYAFVNNVTRYISQSNLQHFAESNEEHIHVPICHERESVCQNCHNARLGASETELTACRQCRAIIARIYAIDYNGRWYCPGCHWNRTNSQVEYPGPIAHYSFKPPPVFHFLKATKERGFKYSDDGTHKETTRLFMGMELEVEMRGKYYAHRNKVAQAFYDNVPHNIAYLKTDATIVQGFEVVTHPATLEWWKESDNPFFLGLKEYVVPFCKSFHTETCGIHIHMNKAAFSPYHLAKFVKFIYANKSFVCNIAERNPTHYCSFESSATGAVQEKVKNAFRKFSPRGYEWSTIGGHGYALNFEHPTTVEVRIFRGNLKIERIIKNFEFLDAVYNFTRVSSYNDIKSYSYVDFNKWLSKEPGKKYSMLKTFINNRVDIPAEEVESEDRLSEERLLVNA